MKNLDPNPEPDPDPYWPQMLDPDPYWDQYGPETLFKIFLFSFVLLWGGKVEPQEVGNPAISAVREAREEAGVIGRSLSLCKAVLWIRIQFDLYISSWIGIRQV